MVKGNKASRRVRQRVDMRLGELERAELVRQLADTDLAFQFKHVLVQDTAYESLLKNDRRTLHLEVARALENSYPDAQDENAALLAEHYQLAGDVEKTILFATRAGKRALNLFAHPEARYFLGIAFELASRREPDRDNTRARIDIALEYFYVSWSQGTTEQNLEQLRELTQTARTLAEQPDGTEADRVRLMRMVGELGNALFARNETAKALACFREILALADSGTFDAAALANAAINTAGVLTVQGHFNQAEPLARRGYELGKGMPAHWFWFGGITFGGLACAARGNPQQAIADLRAGLEQADAVGNLPAAAGLAITCAAIHHMTRDWRALLETGEDAYARAIRSNDSLYQNLALAFCAYASAELGELERARNLLEQSRDQFQANQEMRFFADWTLALFAETLLNLGEIEEARAQADQLIAMAQRTGGIYAEGMGRRARAQLLARTSPGEMQAADDELAAALVLFEQGDARLEMAHTRVVWGELLKQRGNHELARELFRQAATQYRKSGLAALADHVEPNGIA